MIGDRVGSGRDRAGAGLSSEWLDSVRTEMIMNGFRFICRDHCRVGARRARRENTINNNPEWNIYEGKSESSTNRQCPSLCSNEMSCREQARQTSTRPFRVPVCLQAGVQGERQQNQNTKRTGGASNWRLDSETLPCETATVNDNYRSVLAYITAQHVPPHLTRRPPPNYPTCSG